MLSVKQIEIIEKSFELRGNLELTLSENNCIIILDDYDDEWNRVTDILHNEDQSKYHFLNGYYDESWFA